MKLSRGGCLETAAVVLFALLLGAFAASTWLHHRDGVGDEAGSAAADSLAADSARAAGTAIDRSRIRVDVRNGSGLSGAAGRMTDRLRREGFDVVDFGNADRFDHERTFVQDRAPDPAAVREVATALQGVPIEPGERSAYLDVTVVVGRDLEAVLAARAEPESESLWRRWRERLPWP